MSANNLGRSLSFKQARIAVVIALLLGIGFSLLQIASDLRNVQREMDETFRQALKSVEESAFQAAFGLDEPLAATVVRGLFQRAAIIEAKIVDNFGDTMVIESRPHREGAFKWLADGVFDDARTYSVQLRSMETDFHAGELSISVDMYVIAEDFFQRSGLILISGLLRNVILAIILALLFHNMLSKPLRKVAASISAGRSNLPTPHNHENDELGEIVKAHNELSRQNLLVNKRLKEEESRYRTLFEHANDAIFVSDIKTYKILDLNDNAVSQFGYTRQELQRMTFMDLDGSGDPEGYLLKVNKIKKDGELVHEHIYRRKDGSKMPVEISSRVVEAGNLHVFLSFVRDITARKKIEEELLTQSQIITNMVEGAFLARASDAVIVYTNPSFERMFGYESGEMLGMHMSSLNANTDKNATDITDEITRELDKHGVWRGEVCNVKKDGSIFWCSVNISSFSHAVYGDVRVSINADATERRQAEDKLSYQASHDTLTGLINRNEFEQRANRLLSTTRLDQSEHAMCFLDLDQFKVINDTCGHTAGDELLRRLGKLLQKIVRRRDTLARLGGDEFGILMEHCSLEQANRVTSTILQAIKDYQFVWEGEAFRIGASIGLVAITETTANFTELFKQADAACYLAKDLGRNRIHVYLPEDTELAIRHGEMQWVGRINQALDDNRFCLHAQPIIALNSGDQKHYELLVRMLDTEGATIPPGAFLPAAERYGLIEKLDSWVINHACTFLAEHPDFVKQIDFVSINLSGPSLTKKDFLDSIMKTIEDSKIAPSKICFEITETVAVSNLESATHFISTLKEAGCRFALDDFGSGISSFGYLKNLPVDYLKIDGMFVKDIVDDPIDHAMVKSINEIGHVMGLQTIAECVENDEIRKMLKAIGVDYAQGYGLGKPQPIGEILETPSRSAEPNSGGT